MATPLRHRDFEAADADRYAPGPVGPDETGPSKAARPAPEWDAALTASVDAARNCQHTRTRSAGAGYEQCTGPCGRTRKVAA